MFVFISLANERRASRMPKVAPVHLDISFTNSFARGGEWASILHFRRFSIKPIPHLASAVVSRLSSVLISHYLCSVTDHNSSHTYTHTHAALTLARSFIFCGDGSAELADIRHHNSLKDTVFHKILKASHVDTYIQNTHCK